MNQPGDFWKLNQDGQVARLDVLARRALEQFNLSQPKLTLLNYSNNTVYHVDAAGRAYILRIYRPEHRPQAHIHSEYAWLKALGEAGLCVPVPAAELYAGHLQGIEQPVYCGLFDWVPGESIPVTAMSDEQLNTVGAYIAALHHHGRTFTPPPGFARGRLDWGGLFGTVDADGNPSPYDPGAGERFFTDEQRTIIAVVTGRIRQIMQKLDERGGAFGLIHGDLIANNLLFSASGDVCALDFDDCAYGYYLYDLSPLLLGLKDDAAYASKRAALWAGYTSRHPQPDEYVPLLEDFVAARHVASCRWIAGNANNPLLQGRAGDIIAGRVVEMRRYLEMGSLNNMGVR